MASGDVETDDASLIYPYKEETCHPEGYIAFSNKEYYICFPPSRTITKSEVNSENCDQSNGYYQCSQEKGMESCSDSGEEENSPFGSPENHKYEMMAASGKSNSVISRKQRLSNATNEMTEEHERQNTFVLASGVMEQQSGPIANEKACNRGALALTGSRTEQTASKPRSDNYVMPRGEMDSQFVANHYSNRNLAQPAKFDKKEDMFKDINMRLATYLSNPVEWPHNTPSAEVMAEAGLIFKGVFTIRGTTVYDMVECYICKGRLYGFTKDDDPVGEHRRLYPSCNRSTLS